MNATASLIGAVGDRPFTGKLMSEAVRDYWSLVGPLKKAIYNCCLALMKGNPADAEDAVQDVLIHGSKKYPDYAGKIKNFSAWMLRVTKNFCITLIKKSAKQATGVDDIELVSALGAVDRDSAADTPVDWLLSDEESAYIDDAIASLPDTLRGTYSLHFYEGLNPHQIADRQGITKANVYQRISRALNILAPQLMGYFRSESETTGSVQLTKASKSIASSAGSTTRTTSTGCTSQVLVRLEVVAAEKQPPDELLSPEIEPHNICEEAELSGTRPVLSADKCREFAEVTPLPVDATGTRVTPVSGPEREQTSATLEAPIPSYPEKLLGTDQCLDEARLENRKIAPTHDRALDLVSEEISPPLNILATSKQFNILYSQFQIVPENKERSHSGQNPLTARRLTSIDSDRCGESPLIIPWTWLLRGYRALTNLASRLSSDFGDAGALAILNSEFLILNFLMHPEKEPEKIDVVGFGKSFPTGVSARGKLSCIYIAIHP